MIQKQQLFLFTASTFCIAMASAIGCQNSEGAPSKDTTEKSKKDNKEKETKISSDSVDNTDTDTDKTDSSDSVDDTETDTGKTDSSSDFVDGTDKNDNDIRLDDQIYDIKESDIVFDQEQVKVYRLTMDPDDWEHLETAGIDKVYVPTALEVDGETWSDIGVRLKGSYSLSSCFDWRGNERKTEGHCQKLSMKLDFAEYNKGYRYHGLKKLNLHSMSADLSAMHERLAYSIYREMGVIAPRSAHAVVYVNDVFLGIFQAVENIDGRFTAYHYPDDKDGNLYKEVWPRDVTDADQVMESLRTNDNPEDNPSVDEFLDFRLDVIATDDDNYQDTLLPWIDPSQILAILAVDRAIHNWDGPLTFYGDINHNYYWYHLEASNTFALIPWDMDKTFWRYDRYYYPDPAENVDAIPGWNVLPSQCDFITFRETIGPPEEGPGWFQLYPPGCDPLYHILGAFYFETFAEHANTLLDGPFNLDAMIEKLDTWSAQIDDIMQNEPTITYDEWQTALDTLRSDLPFLREHFQSHVDEGYIEL